MGTAGCTFISTQATLIEYDPSDGIGTNVGDVQVRNVIALADETGDVVSLLVTAVNSGDAAVNLNLQYKANGETVTSVQSIPRDSVVSFGNTVSEDKILIENPGVEPGGLLPVYVQYGKYEGSQLMVPVMTAENHPEYADLVPVPVAE